MLKISQRFPRLQAWSELLRRYATVFQHAWQHRKLIDGVARQAHETEFLPAALMLQETPVSPAPRIAMRCLMIFALLMLVWSVFGRVDVVAIAPGKVMPDHRSKLIQPLDSGVIRYIGVRDGQSVKAGDVLIELDSSIAAADGQRVVDELVQSHLQVARAHAMLKALDQAVAPALKIKLIAGVELKDRTAVKELSEHVPAADVKEIEQWKHAQRLLASEWGEYESRLARLDAERARREAEWLSLLQIVQRLEQSLPLTRRRADDYRKLMNDNYVSAHAHQDKEQTRIDQEGELATARSRLNEVNAALRELQAQRRAFIAETRRLQMTSLNEGEQRRLALEQDRDKAQVRLRLAALTSPVDGRVHQLSVGTIGGVVTPAQVLMVIVPDDAPLIVEASLENRDIGFVRAGQVAEVKFETFPFTRYGTVPAIVQGVSADAISDEKRGLVFATHVRLEKSSIRVEDRDVRIAPGMAVTVEIKTGRRRVIEYFLSPLIQGLSESLRER